MDIPVESFAYGDISVQLGIRGGPVSVEADRPAIRLRCLAADLGMGVAPPKYSSAGSPQGVPGQGGVLIQLCEVRGVARRPACGYTRALGHRNRRGQSLR